MEKIKSINELDEKLSANQFVIVDFGSPGCAPCKKVPPLLEEVLKETPGMDLAAYEVDVTEAADLAQKFMILGVPTIIVFKNGKDIERFNSVPKKEKILKALK